MTSRPEDGKANRSTPESARTTAPQVAGSDAVPSSATGDAGETILFGPFVLKPAQRQLLLEDTPIQLGSRALDILCLLVERAGQIVSKDEILERVWPKTYIADGNLRVHVAGLRKALRDGRDGQRYIVNVPNRGYSFVESIQRSADEVAHEAAPPRSVQSASRTLPVLQSRVIGRDQAGEALREQVMQRRLVTVVGTGGVGKTTLAISTATRLLDEPQFAGWRGAYFVDLASLADAKLVPSALASALGVATAADASLSNLIAHLQDKELLVLFDNCEHVIGAVAQIADAILREAPRIHILATSREPLRIEGEWVHHLQPLAMPPTSSDLTSDEAVAYPAVELFIERANARTEAFVLRDEDIGSVIEICRRLDGIPLALELAAGRIDVFGVRGLAAALDSLFAVLTKGRRTALPRHQTLFATLDWSFNLLEPRDRILLQRLSVFSSTFTLGSASAVAAWGELSVMDVVEGISELVSQSLVSADVSRDETFFRLLETTRAYAREKLAANADAGQLARRHAEHCRALISEAEAGSVAGTTSDLREEYGWLIDDVRAALEWSFSVSGDTSVGVDLAVKSAPLFFRLSLLGECERWAERAMSALRDVDRNTERELVLLEAPAMASMFTRGNSSGIRSSIERALSLAEALGDRHRELRLLAGLNIFASRAGEFHWAVSVAQRGVDVAAKAGDPAGSALAEWMVGVSQQLAGDQAAAQRHCERGFEIAAESGIDEIHFSFGYDHRVRARAALARALWLRGHAEQAVTTAHKAVEEAAERAHPINVCLSYIYTIPVFLWIGDLDGAEDRIDRVIAHATRHSFSPYRAVGDALKGELAIRRGDAMTGIRLLRSGLAALNTEHHRTLVASFSRALAEASAGIGQFEDALTIVRDAIASAEGRGGTFELPDLLRAEGQILLSVPQPDMVAAEQALLRAIECAKRQSALSWELRAAMPLARLWAQQGRGQDAQVMLNDLLGQFSEGFDTADLIAAKALQEELAGASL